VIWLQFKSNDDDSMNQRSLFVKENVAALAQKLALNALFLLREQVSTPSAPSELPFPQWFVHCVHHFEKMLYDNAQLQGADRHTSTSTPGSSQVIHFTEP
jgi:hypothetical protein